MAYFALTLTINIYNTTYTNDESNSKHKAELIAKVLWFLLKTENMFLSYTNLFYIALFLLRKQYIVGIRYIDRKKKKKILSTMKKGLSAL